MSAVLEGIGAAPGAAEPAPADLAALYAETRERWSRPGSLHAEAARVPVASGAAPADDAAAAHPLGAAAA